MMPPIDPSSAVLGAIIEAKTVSKQMVKSVAAYGVFAFLATCVVVLPDFDP